MVSGKGNNISALLGCKALAILDGKARGAGVAENMIIEKHFRETERLLRKIPTHEIGKWLLTDGFYPERYVLPPSFQVGKFDLEERPILKIRKPSRETILSISYPKTPLAPRIFGVIHPFHYHDIVFYLLKEFDLILDHLFSPQLKIFSYSNPIPVTKSNLGRLGRLRAGRLIYEWISMAEEDMVLDSGNYRYIVRADVANFYPSIYTHSIAWALHGREESLRDQRDLKLLGTKIDRLISYANDRRTNGIPVGPALCDLLAEIILAKVDREVSEKCEKIGITGARFKDDYRVLCKKEEDGEKFLRALSKVLSNYNLCLNERKTKILALPEGLYREHILAYQPYSLRRKEKIYFKEFELTLLKVLGFHKKWPGTSILEKFLSELFHNNGDLKLSFSGFKSKRMLQIQKVIRLLFFVKRESPKTLCYVLSVIEALYRKYGREYVGLKKALFNVLIQEIEFAAKGQSLFEVTWLIYFVRLLRLGSIPKSIGDNFKGSKIFESIWVSKDKVFPGNKASLFKKPKLCASLPLFLSINPFYKED